MGSAHFSEDLAVAQVLFLSYAFALMMQEACNLSLLEVRDMVKTGSVSYLITKLVRKQGRYHGKRIAKQVPRQPKAVSRGVVSCNW